MDDSSLRPTGSGDLLMAVLHDAGIGLNSVVRVAGRDGLGPMIWLCRRGFEDVGYVRLDSGGPREPADLLLVLHDPPLAELEALLAQHGALKEGGVLILQTKDLRDAVGHDPVHPVLEKAGYRVERCVLRQFRELHVARHAHAASALKKAA
jgi:hypothetical protein